MKYIDAEKLKVELDRQKIGYNIDGKHNAEYDTCAKILRIIDSFQQEQPKKTLTFDGFVDKVGTWFANLRLNKFRKTFNGEIFPATQLIQEYDLFVQELSKTYSDKQERPMVDLEKEIKEWVDLMVGASFPEQDGDFISEEDYRSVIRQTAIHFLGFNARKEE